MTQRPTCVAVTGATGLVGRFLCANLLAHGTSVRALVRSGSNRGGFTQAPQWIEGSLQDLQSLSRLLDGADAVVHCAFEHLPGRYRGGEGNDPAAFWQANLIGTVNLLETARATSVTRVVLLSSRAVFGQRLGEAAPRQVEDATPPSPNTHYGAMKAAVELLGGQYAATTAMCVSSIRPTGVYGVTWPTERSKWLPMVRALRRGESISEIRTATEVHGEDLAAAIGLMLCADPAEISGKVFNCSDICISTRELTQMMTACLGVHSELPAEGPEPVNQMRCAGLTGLGWLPGGGARLQQTITQLCELS